MMGDPRNSGWSYSMGGSEKAGGLMGGVMGGTDFAAMTFGPAFNQAVIAATQAVCDVH